MVLSSVYGSHMPGLLPDLDQGNTELPNSLTCNRNMMSQSSVGFRSGDCGVQSMESVSLSSQELPAYFCHMRLGIVTHHEESRTHWTSWWSDTGSRYFIPIFNSSRGVVTYLVEVCVSLHGYDSLSVTYHQTGHAEQFYKPHNVLQGFSKPFHGCHMCSGWTWSHLWKTMDAIGGPQ